MRRQHSPRSAPRSCWQQGLISLGAGAIAVLWPQFGWTAERLHLSYGLIQRSVPIDSLERYAQDGVIDAHLRHYTHYLSDRQLTQLRPALTTQAQISHVAVSQFLYTPQGEALLTRLSEVVRSETGQPGFYALRAALILAADSDEGLTLLNVLKTFPTAGIQVDLNAGLALTTELQRAVSRTNAAVTLVQQRSQQEAQHNPVIPPPRFPDLTTPGAYDWQVVSITQVDESRHKRRMPVDYYVPDRQGDLTPVPVVVISHGLGSDRTSYAYLAEHLASHGYVVMVPEHPGSSADQIAALINGYADEVTDPEEFINRPRDISALLDDLGQRQTTPPFDALPLDLDKVLVIGQSFGGYTALALAGALVDQPTLNRQCQTGLEDNLNLSLLLQCQAGSEAANLQYLRDARIQGAIALNPVGSAIFGDKGFSQIQVPVLLLSSQADTIAPALNEQIRPFTWLYQSPAAYLALIERGTHFSTIGTGNGDVVTLPSAVIGPSPHLAQDYVKALSLSFLEVHLQDNPAYAPLLTAAYSNYLSQDPLPLSLIQALAPVDLKLAISGEAEGGDGIKAGK